MKINEGLTQVLYRYSRRQLQRVRQQKSIAARTGVIIQALRAAVTKADIYLWNGQPHFFNGKIYVPVTQDEFKSCVYDALVKADLDPAEFVMLEKIQRISLQAVMGKPLKLRRDIVVFENCVLVLPSLKPSDEVEIERSDSPEENIRPHSPELAQTTMCHFNFDPKAECPRWEDFLEDVLENLQMRMVLQEYLGCLFIDRKEVKLEQMLILIGNGSNGKGVVSETIRGIVGKDSMTAFGLDSILSGSESQHNIAKMNGMRVNWCTEIQALQAGRFSDRLKTLISGEPIECRQMYGMPFTATDIPLMVANCNALPPLQDKTYGMQRRFIIIRFDKLIPVTQQDKQLLKKLEPEYPGIFNWILEGRQRFIDQRMSFTRCYAIEDAVKNYIEAANNVAEWCMIKTYKPNPEDVTQDEPLLIRAVTLYDEYRRWCISENISPFSFNRWGMAMTQMGYNRTRRGCGVQFKLYGQRAMARLSKEKAKQLEKRLEEGGDIVNGQELRNGIIYDVGEVTASKQWHISRPYLTILRQRGILDGIWYSDIRMIQAGVSQKKRPYEMFIYDHNRLGRRLEAMGVYDESADFSKLSDRRKEQVLNARAFNEQMEKMDKPFRKPSGKGVKYPDNTIFVDLDWEYTPEAGEALVHQYVEAKAKSMNARAVKIGKRGDMMTKTRKQRLAEAVASKIKGEAIDGSVEPDELTEIDFYDDDDLKVGGGDTVDELE